MNRILNALNKLLRGGDERSVKIKLNIVASLLIKGSSILVSFLLIPLTLGFLNPYEYGVWLTLSSFMQWIDFFDIGLGNGLRNKLSEALAKNDIQSGRIYISTTFIALFIITLVVYSIFSMFCIWADWYNILNVSSELISHLNAIVMIVMAMMCLQFLLKTIVYIYYAKQIAMMSNLVTFLTQLLSLILIFILTKTINGSLWHVATIYSAMPVLVLLISYPLTFCCKYKELAPSISLFRKEYLKDLIGLGVEFFILKIGALLTFATSNIIISRSLSPEEVTPYGIALKYFSLATILFSIIITPVWSASTEAYVKNDKVWLKNSSKSMLKIWGVLSFVCICMVIISPLIYRLWIGTGVTISLTLSSFFALYAIFVNLSTCYSTYLFGMGKVKLQLFSTLIPGVLFVVCAPMAADLWGIEGVALTLALANVPSMILNPIQFNIILSNKKYHNIWYK